MPRILSLTLIALLLSACAGRGPAGAGAPIVDMKGVDPTQYGVDLRECQEYANQVAVGQRAVGGAATGAVVGAAVGAAAGNSDTAKRSAGVGAVLGGARGTGGAVREQRMVVRNCLRNRGYSVLN